MLFDTRSSRGTPPGTGSRAATAYTYDATRQAHDVLPVLAGGHNRRGWSSGKMSVTLFMKPRNSTRQRRLDAMILPVATSSAANNVVVRCRLQSWLWPVEARAFGSFK